MQENLEMMIDQLCVAIAVKSQQKCIKHSKRSLYRTLAFLNPEYKDKEFRYSLSFLLETLNAGL